MTLLRSRLPPWAFVSVAWLGPAILAGLQVYAQSRLGRWDASWKDIAFSTIDWFLYAFLTPLVFMAGRALPLRRHTLARTLPGHVGIAILLCALWAAGGTLLRLAMFGRGVGAGFVSWFFTSLPFGFAVYFAVLAIERALFFLTQSARLSAQLADARLNALRAQLQPHFLYNSLNAITVVARDGDTATATRMLEQLGEMLHRVMRTDRPQEVPLADELAFIRRYLALEEMRFPDRLRPEFAVEPGVERAAVPDLVLQPLVENAIRHGLARREQATLLRVSARREGDTLVLTVTDDGPGPGDSLAERREGVGLRNTRERLATLHGDRGSLELFETPEGGAAVTVRLPYHELAGG